MSVQRRPSPHRAPSSTMSFSKGPGINLPPSRHASRSPSPIHIHSAEKHSSYPGGLRERTTLGKIRIMTQRYRLLLLLALFLFIIFFSHYTLSSPSPSSPSYKPWNGSNLKAINYLNTSRSSGSYRTSPSGDNDTEEDSYEDAYTPPPNPFSFCPIYGPGDDLAEKYGTHVLTQTRIHTGTGDRIMRVLNRAMQGLPVTISILGGSVSTCHGSGDSPLHPSCYPSKLFHWWNTIFPHPATSLTNGALRLTSSSYFAFCSSHHLPDSTDLIIVELDSEDKPEEEWLEYYEVLVRSLLLRPDRPAVLLLGHFSPQLSEAYGFKGADHWHNLVAQFYDVPYISIKSVVWNQIMGRSPSSPPPHAPNNRNGRKNTYKKKAKNEELPKGLDAVSKKYFTDPILPNPHGHSLLSDILIHYFQQMSCEVWDAATSPSSEYPFMSNWHGGVGGSGGGKPKGGSGLFGGVGKPKGVPEPEGEGKRDSKDSSPGGDKDEENEDDSTSTSGEDLPSDADAITHRAHLILSNPAVQKVLNPVPAARINSRPLASNKKEEEIKPFCVSANDLVNPLPPSLFYGSGWSSYHAGSKSGGLEGGGEGEIEGDGGPLRVESHYWYSTLPTSKIRVPIQVGAGDVGVYYMREAKSKGNNKKNAEAEGSGVECWVDDNYAGGKVILNVGEEEGGEARPALQIIDRHVSKGSHFVECVLLGEEGSVVRAFRILGVFST